MLRCLWLVLAGCVACSSMHDKMSSSSSASDREWAEADDKKSSQASEEEEGEPSEEEEGEAKPAEDPELEAMENRSKDGWSTNSKTRDLPAGPQCVDAQGKIQECMTDKDCCPNFYCGIDPDGSTRIKVCIYGGK